MLMKNGGEGRENLQRSLRSRSSELNLYKNTSVDINRHENGLGNQCYAYISNIYLLYILKPTTVLPLCHIKTHVRIT